jgi:hypothetical protein
METKKIPPEKLFLKKCNAPGAVGVCMYEAASKPNR